MHHYIVTLIDKRRVHIYANDQHLALRAALDRYGITAVFAVLVSTEEALS